MKSIKNIIASEVVTKVNNVNVRKEAGDYGTSGQITDGTSGEVIFSTDYSIEEIVYVSVEGDVMIPIEEYIVTGANTVQVMPNGVNPPQGSNIFICYLRARGAFTVGADPAIQVPPTIDSLFLNPQTGGVDLTKFNFTITTNDGANISWKLFKTGTILTELFSGTSLSVVDGALTPGGPEQIVYDLTAEEQAVGYANFSLHVTYTLLDTSGTPIPGTLEESTVYTFDVVSPITGTLVVLPAEVTATGSINVTATYSISNLSAQNLEWRLIRNKAPEGFPDNNLVLDTGIVNSSISAVYNETYIIEDWTQDVEYSLEQLIEGGGISLGTWQPLAVDTIDVNLLIPVGLSKVGYEQASKILVETSPGSGVYVPISTEAEYNANVDPAHFTKIVSNVYLTNNQFLDATVPAYGILENDIYFMMEVPDSWGDVIFYNDFGNINMAGFTVIQLLSNFSKVYIYTASTSTTVNPIDFKVKNP